MSEHTFENGKRLVLRSFLGEKCHVSGIVLSNVYDTSKALFGHIITLGSVRISAKGQRIHTIDHLNILVNICDYEKTPHQTFLVGNRISLSVDLKLYNHHTTKTKTDVTCINPSDFKVINYIPNCQELTTYLKRRTQMWSLSDDQLASLEDYVRSLPNNGSRERFVQSIRHEFRTHRYFVRLLELERYLNLYPNSEMRAIVRNKCNLRNTYIDT